MKILIERPPRYEEIVKVFPEAASPSVIYAWGDVIYNPSGKKLTKELLDHEELHGSRQKPNVEAWWDRYLVDVEFRFTEELLAHRQEYQTYCRRHENRTKREKYLQLVAHKLASPLYGSLLTPQKALDLLR